MCSASIAPIKKTRNLLYPGLKTMFSIIQIRIWLNLIRGDTSFKEPFTHLHNVFFLTWKKNRVPAATTARSFLKLSGALKSQTPIIPPTFDRIEFLFLISEIELPKLGVLEKGGLKMDQNYGFHILDFKSSFSYLEIPSMSFKIGTDPFDCAPNRMRASKCSETCSILI